MRAACAFATLIFSASTLFSQTAPTAPATVVITGVSSQNCPIGVTARRGAPGGMALAQDAPSGFRNGKLYLHFAPASKAAVVAATVVLHGTNGNAHAELVADSSFGYNLTEKFELTGSAETPLRDSSVSLSRLVNVRWVSIIELSFADGTTWHESHDSSCHVTPNGFRLVGAEN